MVQSRTKVNRKQGEIKHLIQVGIFYLEASVIRLETPERF
jgi:hypothetical protein